MRQNFGRNAFQQRLPPRHVGFDSIGSGTTAFDVHISAVERAGLSGLAEGQKVSYEIKMDSKRGKTSAENLRV